MSARNTIVLQGDLATYHDERRVKTGVTTVRPGMLAEIDVGDVLKPHATAGGAGEILVVKEDSYQGKTVDDLYAAGDPCFFHRAQKGDKLQMILLDGEVATLATLLTSDGAGRLKVATGADVVLFKPAEALSPSGADGFISVYVL